MGEPHNHFRWKIDLFFKGFEQNLRIKTFVGTSENAVKGQIRAALIAMLLAEVPPAEVVLGVESVEPGRHVPVQSACP